MPHVIVKMVAGRSDAVKRTLAERITQDIVKALGVGEDAISVAIEDIPAGEWTAKVYTPDISPRVDELYKKPGYDPFV